MHMLDIHKKIIHILLDVQNIQHANGHILYQNIYSK
jgi:hypothetical protein